MELRAALFQDVGKLFCLRGMNRGFIEDDDVLAEVDPELGVSPKKAVAELTCLADEIPLVFLELLVLARVVPDDDERDPCPLG